MLDEEPKMDASFYGMFLQTSVLRFRGADEMIAPRISLLLLYSFPC